ncbi:KamA family radical SAM protein [Halocella sp. SP3-1]|uniref:KamA family radical SAM protein n=1 Tax=Halocella sp. SP3-1 TaxID=2382161 RepID=UPI000F75D2DD|nr:KamA family radical SAM protein [Halocella sp. SP3-1]AZO94156.1 KamA family radical SAM protein [Halocella sp. SP3-1]
MQVKYFTNLDQLEDISAKEKEKLKKVSERYPFRANDYYLSLIDWNDPLDPIKRIIIPSTGELNDWGELDPSEESKYTVMPGLEHKYDSTVLLLISNVCGGICRYCFRKRIFKQPNQEYLRDIEAAVDYIRGHKEVTNVLLTGGDSFMLPTKRLKLIVGKLREIGHVKIIRFGTKMPVFNPYRILEDSSLIELIKNYSTPQKRIYIITDINHPKELSKEAIKGLKMLFKAGAILTNQTPLIRNLNDDPEVMAELFRRLSFIGVPPYYVFQCRPSVGNKEYAVPIEKGYEIYEQAKSMVSGLAKSSHFVLSHASGKIEVVGMNSKKIFLKYHRAFRNKNSSRFFSCKRNSEAYWLEDYDELACIS